MWFGFGLVIVGVVLLLNTLGILKGDAWNYVWPIVIIFIGISMMVNKRKDNCCPPKDKDDTKKEA